MEIFNKVKHDLGGPEEAAAASSLLSSSSSGATLIPVKAQGGGTYVVPVLINKAITLNFVIDSGASDVSIPADVVLTLVRCFFAEIRQKQKDPGQPLLAGYAKEAMLSACDAKTDNDRQGLLELARTWTQAALVERQSINRARPSEVCAV